MIQFAILFLMLAMSDAKALNEAKRLFGAKGGIATSRAQTDTYWTKQVGVNSPQCKDKFTVFGAGLNTWEAAFFQVPVDTVKGPFSGVMTLKQSAYDDISVTSIKFVINDVVSAERIVTPGKVAGGQMNWDTREFANGVHVVCSIITDSDGNVSRTPAWPILIDQTKPSLGTVIDFTNVNGLPLVSGGN